MNPTSEDIKDLLVADSSLELTFATNIFVGKEPDTPADCVTVFDTAGYPPVLVLNRGGGNFYKPSIHIRVRNRVYLTGYQLAFNIMKSLHGRGPEVVNGNTYMSIVCVSDPALLDWDLNGRARFFMNFNIQRREG